MEDCVLELQGGRVQVSVAQAPSAKVAAKKAAAAHDGKLQRHRQLKDLDKASDPALTGARPSSTTLGFGCRTEAAVLCVVQGTSVRGLAHIAKRGLKDVDAWHDCSKHAPYGKVVRVEK